MTTEGTVRLWHEDEGWGVIDSSETPGGCWAHFGAVAIEGYRTLRPGQAVHLEWEAADQDRYAYRAVRTWPQGQQPYDVPPSAGGGAYHSTLEITYDDDSR
ncbi:MAG TPA: cold shock domain-containing protein [Catenuloplanes sp.]